MTTLQDWINETKQHLYGGEQEEINFLSANIVAGDTSIVFSDALGGISRGAILSSGLERFLVRDTNPATRTVTVIRGYLGTTATSHTAGDIFTVRPKFDDYGIARAINQDLMDLSSPSNGLFQAKAATDITYNAAIMGYNVAGVTDPESVLEAQFKDIGPAQNWPRVTRYRIARDMSASEFASGVALFIYDDVLPGTTIHVTYRAGFDLFTLTTAHLSDDAEATTGIPSTALDIPPLGAAIRLVSTREIKRNLSETQGSPRRAEEVPPGSMLRAAQFLDALRTRRIQAESSRLTRLYPTRRTA